jgi:hypothetical protein
LRTLSQNPACADGRQVVIGRRYFELNISGRPRDSDPSTFNTQARLARDVGLTASRAIAAPKW